MWHLIIVRRIIFFFSICLCLAALTARAAHTHVQLLLSANPAKPGDTILVGVDMKMDRGLAYLLEKFRCRRLAHQDRMAVAARRHRR